MNNLKVYKAVLALMREALTGENADFKEYAHNNELWEKVYTELQNQAVLGITADAALLHNEIPEAIKQEWKKQRTLCVAKYCYMAMKQREVCDILQEANIPVAVMKGMAAAIYYPVPETRAMGDIDLIVLPTVYNAAVKLLKDNGYKASGGDINDYHTALNKGDVIIELHRSPGIVKDRIYGENVRKYVLSGINNIEECKMGPFRFPILPVKQNGMELIWHIRQHLYNGLGIRQIIDWMMFVVKNLDDNHYQDYREDLEKCGLNNLAIHVTRMCQKYLGLQKETITWCRDADDKVCDDLMMFVLEQGNFGRKKETEDKMVKVLSGYTSLMMLLEKFQAIGEKEWSLARKYPRFKFLAWIYGGGKIVGNSFLQSKNISKTIQDYKIARRRRKMFKKLYTITSTRTEIKAFLLHIRTRILFRKRDLH